jgi:hypothetical protein
MRINYLAVLVATIVHFLIGGLIGYAIAMAKPDMANKSIAAPPLPLDLDRFKVLADEIDKLNSKLNYTYGGTIK